MHWTSNYGTGIVFIGNMLSWLNFHNFSMMKFKCSYFSYFSRYLRFFFFQKAIVQYITFKTAALYLRKIKQFL